MVKGDSSKQLLSLMKDEVFRLDESLDLAIEDYARIPLLIQSAHGRIIQGHGFFKGKARPETTMDEICLACDLDPKLVRWYRQKVANDVRLNAIDLFKKKKKKFTNREGEPLGGVKFLEGLKFEINKELFQGYAIGGRMDTPEYRALTENLYPETLDGKKFKIGYGKEHLINLERLKESNISINSLSEFPHSEKTIKRYITQGIILSDEIFGIPGRENKFIRYSEGLGICDDAIMISVGRKYRFEAMNSLFITDMVDTYTKFNEDRISGGEDEFLGKLIEKMWFEKYHEPLISSKETAEIIYLGAKNNIKISSHSSSHRYLIQRNDNSELATFLNHQKFVKSGQITKYKLGMNRLESKIFYKNMNRRFEEINKIGTVHGNDYSKPL